MDIRHLRNFITLAEELHFGRAAARLSMTQPPLSSSIMQLEDELGARLFERDKKKVTMTAAGLAFLPEAQQILASLVHAREIAASVARGSSGHLSVGYSSSMLYRGVPKVLKAYLAENPGVDLVLHEANASQLVESLRHGVIDAAFANMARIPDGLEGHVFSREEFVCCVPADHRLATAHSLQIADLRDELFVMFRRESSPANYDNIIGVCRNGGIEPKIRYGASHWMNMVALVGNGFGVAIVPRSLSGCGIADAAFVPLEPRPGWCYGSFLWSRAHLRPTLPALVNLAQKFAVKGDNSFDEATPAEYSQKNARLPSGIPGRGDPVASGPLRSARHVRGTHGRT